MHFMLALTCGDCGAQLVFNDERPEWKVEHATIDDDAGVQAAEAYIAEHPTIPAGRGLPSDVPKYVVIDRRRGQDAMRMSLSLELPEPRRYVACPACDGRVCGPALPPETPLPS